MPDPTRVLLVEDNLVNRKVAQKMLERIGCCVTLALDGQEALSRHAAAAFDLILMDCQMPVLDGYAATQEIRRREGSSRHTPILALTAHALVDDRERCLAAGMDGHLSKPITIEHLRAAVERWAPSAPQREPLASR